MAPATAFVAAFLIYAGTALWVGRTSTPRVAYFDYLAESFVQGRFDLPSPPGRHDLCEYNGCVYVVFPPLPALLLMPWVALVGRQEINTVAFSVVVGALNVALVAAVVQALRALKWTPLSLSDGLGIVAAFALCTVHWYSAVEGSAWFLGQVCTLTFALAALLAILRGHALATGGALLAAAMLGRPHELLLWPLLAAAWRLRQLEQAGKVASHRKEVLSAWPVALACGLLLSYNAARFGHPLEFGYKLQNVATSMMGDLHGRGVFNIEYLPRNAETMLVAPPHWDANARRPIPDDNGMGLLWTTPVVLLCLAARTPRDLVRSAWTAIALILVPLLTYYNTGSRQFGYRFSLDFMPAVIVLWALAWTRWRAWAWVLLLLGIAVNIWGVAWWFEAAKAFV